MKIFLGPFGYAIANLLSAASGFVLVPLLTRTLSADGMASWIVMEPALILLGQLLMLGLGHAVLQQLCEAKLDRKNVFYSHISALSLVSLGCLIFGAAALFIFDKNTVLLFLLNVITEVMLGYVIYYARASNDLKIYYSASVARPLLIVIAWMTVSYISSSGWQQNNNESIENFLLIRFCIAAFIFAVIIWGTAVFDSKKQDARAVFEKKLIFDAIKFGIPLTIASALVAFQDFLVRYLLANFVRQDILLEYYVHLKAVALVGNFVVSPLAIWWGAERYRAMAKGDSHFNERANSVMIKSCALYAFLSAIFLVVLPWTINIFSPGMQSSMLLASLLLAVPFTQMLVHLTNAGLMRQGVTKYQIVVQSLSLVTVSIGCVGLLRWMGIGVAGAFLLANLMAFSVSYYLSIKFYPVRYRVVRSVGAAGFVFIVAYFVINLTAVSFERIWL